MDNKMSGSNTADHRQGGGVLESKSNSVSFSEKAIPAFMASFWVDRLYEPVWEDFCFITRGHGDVD